MSVPLFGQVTVSASAQRLASASSAAPVAFTIKASSANNKPVFVGDSTVTSSTGFQMDAGDEFNYEVLTQNGQPTYQLRPSDFWVVGTASDKISWIGSPSA